MLTGLLWVLWVPGVRAQAPGVAIEMSTPLAEDAGLLRKAKALRQSRKLLKREKVVALLKNPQPAAVALPEAHQEPLSGRAVAERARKGYVRVGWYYLCADCDDWHLNLGGGYAISADGVVATCHHVIAPDDTMREGYLVAVDAGNTVFPVTSVLAASEALDTAIVRVPGGVFTPLPLNDQVAPGDPAYLFSDPAEVRGYFSSGIVNRFYWGEEGAGNLATLEGVKHLRLNVSTDWAPGSSGSAVLDGQGNAMGHVSSITPVNEEPTDDPGDPVLKPEDKSQPEEQAFSATYMSLHEAVPARCVMLLIQSMQTNAAAEPPKPLDPKRKRGFATKR